MLLELVKMLCGFPMKQGHISPARVFLPRLLIISVGPSSPSHPEFQELLPPRKLGRHITSLKFPTFWEGTRVSPHETETSNLSRSTLGKCSTQMLTPKLHPKFPDKCSSQLGRLGRTVAHLLRRTLPQNLAENLARRILWNLGHKHNTTL